MATAVRTRRIRDEKQARFPARHAFHGGGLQQFARNLRTHIVILVFHCRRALACAGNLGSSSKHVYADVDVVACCVGIRADLVCKIDHLPRLRLVDIWQANPKFSSDAEPTFRASRFRP